MSNLVTFKDSITGDTMTIDRSLFSDQRIVEMLGEWFADAPEEIEHALEQLVDYAARGKAHGLGFAVADPQGGVADLEALLSVTVTYGKGVES